METDTLNTLVTDAIWRAEELEALGMQPTSTWREVSTLEEDLAKAFPPSEFQGQVARRGAVRAALSAGDYERAQTLADAYLADESAPEYLKVSVQEILVEADQALTMSFPHAAKHLHEARILARCLSKTGPFGLAA